MFGNLLTLISIVGVTIAVPPLGLRSRHSVQVAGTVNFTDLAPGLNTTPPVERYVHGRCSFHVTVIQTCVALRDGMRIPITQFTMPDMRDAAKNTVGKPAIGAIQCDDRITRDTGLDHTIAVKWIHPHMNFRYDKCDWYSDSKPQDSACGDCGWGEWTAGEPNCYKEPLWWHRTSDMDCSMNC